MLALLVHASLALHMVVGGDVATQLVERWRPDPNKAVPISLHRDLRQYSKARICVGICAHRVGVVQHLDDVVNMYVCKYEDSVLTIHSCLWGASDLDATVAFRHLFEWFERVDPTGVIVSGALVGMDREACLANGGV